MDDHVCQKKINLLQWCIHKYSIPWEKNQTNVFIILLSLYNLANKLICQGYNIRENRTNSTDEMSSTFYTANGFRKLVM